MSYIGVPISLGISVALILAGYEVKPKEQLKDVSFLGMQCLFALISALTGCIQQIAVNIAFRYDDAAKISIYRTLDLFFTFLMQYFFLNIHPNMYSIIGSVLICAGNILILGFKMIDDKLVSNEMQKKTAETEQLVINGKEIKTELSVQPKTNFLDSLKKIIFLKF